MVKEPGELESVSDFAERHGVNLSTATPEARAAAFAGYSQELSIVRQYMAAERGVTLEELHSGAETSSPQAEATL